MLEKGRLYFLRKDGSKDSVYLNIKQERFLFGSSDCCAVRIYIDGIFPKHCVLTVSDQGKAYLEPLHPSALTLVNSKKIKRKICLKNNDVVTIVGKEFQFSYPTNSLLSNVLIERLLTVPFSKQAYLELLKPSALTLVNGTKIKQKICLKNNDVVSIVEREFQFANLPCSLNSYVPIEKLLGEPLLKQINSSQNIEIFALGKNRETPRLFREYKVAYPKLFCMIKNDIFREIPEYLLKFAHQECANISYKNIHASVADFSCTDKHLMKYMNQYVGESTESRKYLFLKLYEFFSFIIELLSRNEECIFDLLPVLHPVWKYSMARASEDVLFLPLKFLYLKYLNQGEINVNKKSLQNKILYHASKYIFPYSADYKIANPNCIPKKLICMIESDIFMSFSEYLLKFAHHEYVNFTFDNINAPESNFSGIDKPLMKYTNQYVGESTESRRKLALKLYEFFSFIKKLVNRNEECKFLLLQVLQSVCKYSVSRASDDILFLPLKYLYLKYLSKGEITVNKKSLPSSILPLLAKKLSPISEISKEKNNCIEQKQNQDLCREISISYRKRVSLAVKRYQLRKRKSMMKSKSLDIGNGNLGSTDERCREDNSVECDVVTNLEEEKATRTRRKRCYNKKEKEELDRKKELKKKQEISVEVVHDFDGEENIPAKPTNEKRRNKKTRAKKTELKQEDSVEAVHDTIGKENILAESTKEKPRNKKKAAKKTDFEQDINLEPVHDSVGKENIPDKLAKEKRRNKKTAKNTDLGLQKESIEYACGVQFTSTKTIELKETSKRKKKEAPTNKTALGDEMETIFTHDTSGKQQNILKSSEPKTKKGKYKKKKEVLLEKHKTTEECDKQELPQSQRITRSMVKNRP